MTKNFVPNMFTQLRWKELTYEEQEYFCEAFLEKTGIERTISDQIDEEYIHQDTERENQLDDPEANYDYEQESIDFRDRIREMKSRKSSVAFNSSFDGTMETP